MDQVLDASKFCWFEGDQMHVDIDKFAELRGIPVREAAIELLQALAKLLPDTPVHFVPKHEA